MKNVIIIDVDTDRDPIVQLGKPSAELLPKNPEEAKETITRDIACMCEALSILIQVADKSGYKTVQESVKDCIVQLERNTTKES